MVLVTTALPDAVLLTDDEVVAVSACLGSPWPTSTPTVNQSDVDALLAAIERGRRSLAVRELLVTEGADLGVLDEQVQAAVGESLASGLIISVHVTDLALRPLGLPPNYHHYGAVGDEVWVVDAVVPAGAHRIGRANRSDCLQMLAALLDATWTDGIRTGPCGETEKPWLCVLGGVTPGTGVPTRGVLVGLGEIRPLDLVIADDGSVTGRPADGPDSVDDVPAWLGLPPA
jgi:hypothetical protein